jgi:ABC-type lipoprotein export system ATPase subunit
LITTSEEENIDQRMQVVFIDETLVIARVLSTRPALILADEPTGELDSATGQQILALLRRVVDQEGTTVLVATHDLTVDLFADEVVHLEDGRLTVPGGIAQVGRRTRLHWGGIVAAQRKPTLNPA